MFDRKAFWAIGCLILGLNCQLAVAQALGGQVDVSPVNDMTAVVVVDTTADSVEITLSGRDGAWFGYGFGSDEHDGTYSIVVDLDGSVEERMLGQFAAGALLMDSVIVEQNNVQGAIRTVVLNRAITGVTSSYFTFPASASSFDGIWARGGDGQSFSAHSSSGTRRGTYSLNLTEITIDPIFRNGFEAVPQFCQSRGSPNTCPCIPLV
jgi:hypothetical protein